MALLAPPSYTLSSSSPPYSRSPSIDERVLEVAVSPSPVQPAAFGEYRYSNKHLELCLGMRVHKTEHPSYGRNSIIDGWVRLKDCSDILRVEMSIEGYAMTKIHGTDESAATVLLISQILYSNDIPSASSGNGHHPFSCALPSSVRNGRQPLPPTFDLTRKDARAKVFYFVKIHVTRKWWRRDASIQCPFFYLPRSRPPAPDFHAPRDPYSETIPEKTLGIDLRQWKIVDIMPTSSCNETSVPLSSGQFALPRPPIFPSGQDIPFAITIVGPSSSLTDLVSGITVELCREDAITALWKTRTAERNISWGVVDSVSTQPVDEEGRGGFSRAIVKGHIRAGESEAERTWQLDRYIDVKYFIRLTVSVINSGSKTPTPCVRHEEFVKLTTHEWDVDDFDSDMPALGLLPN